MPRTVWAICFAAVVLSGLLGQSLSATTVVVGPSTCKSTLKHYSTIQSAVSAVPWGTTVMVCPGSYPEQVTVTQPLTLEGITDGTGSAAVITVPGGGFVQNGTSNSFGPVAVQLLVQNTVGVTIKALLWMVVEATVRLAPTATSALGFLMLVAPMTALPPQRSQM